MRTREEELMRQVSLVMLESPKLGKELKWEQDKREQNNEPRLTKELSENSKPLDEWELA